MVITDTVTLASAWQTYTVDIPGTVGGATAYVGFTGADGGAVSDARILAWQFQSPSTKPALSSIAVTPNSLCGGLTAQGVVTLQQAVQTDTVIALSSRQLAGNRPLNRHSARRSDLRRFPGPHTADAADRHRFALRHARYDHAQDDDRCDPGRRRLDRSAGRLRSRRQSAVGVPLPWQPRQRPARLPSC